MHVRVATAADYDGVVRLLQQLNPGDPAPGAAHRAVYDRLIESTRDRLLVVTSGARVVVKAIPREIGRGRF